MATWTSPPSFTTGQKPGSAHMNTYIVENLKASVQPPTLCCTASSTSNVANNTWTLVAFDGDVINTVGTSLHDTATNNSRLIAPVAGVYRIHARTAWAAASGNHDLSIRKNSAGSNSGGSLVVQESTLASSARYTSLSSSALVSLSAGDYLEVFRFQFTGSSLAPASLGGAAPAIVDFQLTYRS